MKSEARNKARELRHEGKSIKEITKLLNVSQSSVSTWVRDIELNIQQIEQLKNKNPLFNAQLHGSKQRAEKARRARQIYQEEGKTKAKEGNLLHQAGCMLYWAEGTKSKNTCALINTDINLLLMFKRFLIEQFNLKSNDFIIKITCYTNNNLTKEEIENYWLESLNLPKDVIRKGQENNRPKSSTNSIRHNKHPYGMCCIMVKKSTHIVQHIYGAIQEYAGFSNQYMLQ